MQKNAGSLATIETNGIGSERVKLYKYMKEFLNIFGKKNLISLSDVVKLESSYTHCHYKITSKSINIKFVSWDRNRQIEYNNTATYLLHNICTASFSSTFLLINLPHFKNRIIFKTSHPFTQHFNLTMKKSLK